MFNRTALDNKIAILASKLKAAGIMHEFVQYPEEGAEFSTKGYIMGVVSQNGVVMFSNATKNGKFVFVTFDATLQKQLKEAGLSSEEAENQCPTHRISELDVVNVLAGKPLDD